MAKEVVFGRSDVLAEATNSDIDTAEEDIVSVSSQGYLTFSQLSAYVTMDLGTHTTVDLRIYHRNEVNGTWHQFPKINKTTGVVEDNYYRFNSSTPANVILDLPISGCFALKVTGQGVGGANGAVTVKLLGRTN